MFNSIFKVRNAAVLLLSAFFFACDDPKDIGYELPDSGSITPYYTDTLGVLTSTVLADSAINANQNYVLTGLATDPVFGKVKANAYLQPSLGEVLNQYTGVYSVIPLEKKENAVVDSIKLRLAHTGIYLGDTLSKTEFSVFRLKKPLTWGKYYNFNENMEYESTPVVTFSVNISDFKNAAGDTTKVHFIHLPKAVGEELLAIAGTDASKDKAKFNEAFRGFAVVPSSGAKAVYGFNVGPLNTGICSLDLYYRTPAETASTVYYFEFNGPRYSYLQFDRSATKLAGLKNGGDEIVSSLTNGQTFIQGGSGIATKITLSGLKNLGTKYQVNKASLEFKLDSTVFNKLYSNNFYFALSEVDSRNQQKRINNRPSYLTISGTGLGGSPGIMIDSSKTVTFDITYFVHSLSLDKTKDQSLLILPAGLSASQTALISNDNLKRSVLNKPKLKLYYSK